MKDNPRDDELKKIRTDLYHHPEKIMKTEEAADSVFYSYRWFVVCWKMLFHVSYKEDVDRARAQYIKMQIKKWKRIPEIAESLKLSECAISRIFKRVYGETIKEFFAREVGL